MTLDLRDVLPTTLELSLCALIVGSICGMAAALAGAFLTETVFSWPGVGRYLVGAVLGRDVFTAQNVMTLLALLVVATASAASQRFAFGKRPVSVPHSK